MIHPGQPGAIVSSCRAHPAGKEPNWIATVPGKAWFAFFRLYGSLAPWFDKTGQPGEIELVHSE